MNVCGALSLAIGIIGLFVLPLWCGIAAVILGVIGLCKSSVCYSGKGVSISGIVLGAISIRLKSITVIMSIILML